MSTILITGGLGYIGSHTCLNLLKNGFDLVIIDSLINSSEKILKKITQTLIKTNGSKNKFGKYQFRKGDLKNTIWLNKIFNEFTSKNEDIDFVIHLAGLKSVEESTTEPLRYWEENLENTFSLLSAMKLNNCRKLIFSSSAMVYKPIHNKLLEETSPLQPYNPYGNSKLAIENLLRDIYKYDSANWKIAMLRYFNPVGAHELGILGENQSGKATNLFPVIGQVLTKKLDKISIFGKDWPTKDGTCIRDFIHIEDLAEAHFQTLIYLKKNKPQLIDLNIGTGKGTSILELIKTFEKVNNLNLPYEFVNRREGDLPYLVANNKKCLKLLNWQPQKSLEDMCSDFGNYIFNNFSNIN